MTSEIYDNNGVEAELVQPELVKLERLAKLLDNKFRIPGTRYRFGFDAILGFIPGFGDFAGAALSSYIIYEAYILGVRPFTLGKMAGNICLDAAVGIIPFIGDFFDIAFQANRKNVALALLDLRGRNTKVRTLSQLARALLWCGLTLFLMTGGFVGYLIIKLIQ